LTELESERKEEQIRMNLFLFSHRENTPSHNRSNERAFLRCHGMNGAFKDRRNSSRISPRIGGLRFPLTKAFPISKSRGVAAQSRLHLGAMFAQVQGSNHPIALLSVLECKRLGHRTGAKGDDSISLLQILLWKPFTSRTRNTRSKWHLFCRWLWSMGQFLIINYGTLSIGKIVT
jgi:hypothetical protein